MDKPHLSKFVFEAFDPVHEAGKQARWYGVLAEFQKGSDGVYRKVLSGELSVAQLEAQGYPRAMLGALITVAALARAEAAEAVCVTLRNDAVRAIADRDRVKEQASAAVLSATSELSSLYIDFGNLNKKYDQLYRDLQDALQARDNFAALEKKARGETIAVRAIATQASEQRLDAEMKLEKIPSLIRRLFGAI